MRLTEKIEDETGYYYVGDYSLLHQLNDKLGQLEDIEEELGIDLSFFVSLFKDNTKIYVKSAYCCEAGEVYDLNDYQVIWKISFDDTNEEVPDYAKDYANKWHIEFYVPCGEYESFLYVVNIKDYGKTWALDKNDLTSEELE